MEVAARVPPESLVQSDAGADLPDLNLSTIAPKFPTTTLK
jgi:hypothetical protein